MARLELLALRLVVMAAVGLAAKQAASRQHRATLADGTVAAVVKHLVQVGRTPTHVAALLCTPSRGRALSRALTAQGLQVAVVDRGEAWVAALPAHREAVAVLLDAACPEAPRLLAAADRMDRFRVSARWVLINADGGTGLVEDAANQTAVTEARKPLRAEDAVPRSAELDACYSGVDGVLDGLGVLLDSDVTAVCADKDVVVAVAAYRASRGLGLRFQMLASWPAALSARTQADPRALPGRRVDLEKSVMNVGFVVAAQDKFMDLVAHGGTSPDLMAAFNYEMIHYVTDMVNAKINITYVPSYGQVKDNTVPTEGLFGMTVRKELELCGSPVVMLLDPVRLKYFEYTNVFVPVEGAIVFRAPPLSYEYNVFTLPFPATLWAAAAAVVLVCTGLLTLVMRSESSLAAPKFGDDYNVHAMHSGRDALLMTVAAVCQQGYSMELRSVPGRITVLMMLMLLLLLYTCYTASIVVLMQSTSTKITHHKDLLDTQIKFGLINIPYVVFFSSKETEPVRRKLWTDKVLEHGRRKNLYNVTEAVRKVQREYFALHGPKNLIYGEIGRTWTEDEKCGLVVIGKDFVRVRDPQIVLASNSHNAEAIRIMLRRLVERGIRGRFERKYAYARPTCSNKAARFNSVSLTDVRAPFEILLSLMAGSAAVLLAEVAWHRRHMRRTAFAEPRPEVAQARVVASTRD